MIRSLVAGCTVLVAASVPGAPRAAAEGAWVTLFDGTSTDAWKAYGKTDPITACGWTVEGGALHAVPNAAPRCDLATKETFKDFDLELEWKVSPGGNSGVMFDVAETAAPSYETGPEMQVLDDERHPDGRNPLTSAGALYALVAPRDKTLSPVGEWNTARLVKKGAHVEHWLNGRKIVEYELGSPELTKRIAASKFKAMPRFAKEGQGRLVLQHHGQEVWFRNVRVKGEDPPPSPRPEPTRAAPPTRSADGPGAPRFTVIGKAGANAPVDADGDFVIGPDYRPAAELTVADGVPRGTIRQFTMESKDSTFYPGIARDVFGTVDPKNPKTLIVETHPQPWRRAITVYVPAQYRPGSEAPFIVVHDGPALGKEDAALAAVLDNLIAERRVPPMIAVMIQNGGGDAQGHERGLEYDTMSGTFAEFIEAEVLPAVERTLDVKLTRSPDGRAAMGCSSGAAAAFTMAWYHPEWYRRVISYSGTFVNQQWPFDPRTPDGAWGYHTGIIAAAAPRPIRVWMHVGDRDLYNPNVMRDGMHDWVEANHRMAAVLKDKGYRYQYTFALDSGHCDRRVREQTLPEALEWVWRDDRP